MYSLVAHDNNLSTNYYLVYIRFIKVSLSLSLALKSKPLVLWSRTGRRGSDSFCKNVFNLARGCSTYLCRASLPSHRPVTSQLLRFLGVCVCWRLCVCVCVREWPLPFPHTTPRGQAFPFTALSQLVGCHAVNLSLSFNLNSLLGHTVSCTAH